MIAFPTKPFWPLIPLFDLLPSYYFTVMCKLLPPTISTISAMISSTIPMYIRAITMQRRVQTKFEDNDSSWMERLYRCAFSMHGAGAHFHPRPFLYNIRTAVSLRTRERKDHSENSLSNGRKLGKVKR